MNNTIFESNNLRVYVSNTANPQAKTLLENTIFGNKGIKYQHTGVKTTISNLINPYFFHLYLDDELIGFYCLCKRTVDFTIKNIDAFYGRYLTIMPKYSGYGYGKILKKEAIKHIESIYSGPILFYSYV